MSTLEDIVELSEGNPGAATVLAELLANNKEAFYTYFTALFLENIRGWKIWVGYKDVCERDIESFKQKIMDGSLLEEIKKTRAYQACEQ